MSQIRLNLKASPSETFSMFLLGRHVEGFRKLKLLLGSFTKICLDVTSNDNVRSRNSLTL